MAVLSMGGCVPVPHRQLEGPDLEVFLTDESGAPLANVTIGYVADSRSVACSDGLAAQSDSMGLVRFKAPRRWALHVILVPAHRIFEWSLCAETGGNESQAIFGASAYQNLAPWTDRIECVRRLEHEAAWTCESPYGMVLEASGPHAPTR